MEGAPKNFFSMAHNILYANPTHTTLGNMSYDLNALSPSDFESLSADLVGREIGERFEEFGDGPDGGIDGRHVSGSKIIVLQSKHYARSGYSALKAELRKERAKIDRLDPDRYVLTTSVSLTPARKTELAGIIGPASKEAGDIIGADELQGLLRANPDIVEAHPRLWETSGAVLKTVLDKTLDEREARNQAPTVLRNLLPKTKRAPEDEVIAERDVVFLIGSRPNDDEFILWLGPKLESHGYTVFSELLTLEPGTRWRKEVNLALQHRGAKVLVTASDSSSRDDHVLDLIDKAIEVGQSITDSKYVIPLRVENSIRLDGLRDAVPVDFVRGWAEGLEKLLAALKRDQVPCNSEAASVAPQWDTFRKHGAIPIVNEPEKLISNWLRIVEMPDHIHYYEASGVIREDTIKRQVKRLTYEAKEHGRGLFTFADPHDIEESFESVAKFVLKESIRIDDFVEHGAPVAQMKPREASNLITFFIRNAWERHCTERGMISYDFSGATGFHVSSDQASNGQKIRWGQQGDGRRSSMLRNIANKHVWKYGVSAIPRLWPFWHIRLKARVLFAEDNGTAEGKPINDAKKMHRLRRAGCKGWRNKQWHGRLLAFLELISAGSAFIRVRLAPGHDMLLSSEPIMFTSPVSTKLPDVLDADGEEEDESTLGRSLTESDEP